MIEYNSLFRNALILMAAIMLAIPSSFAQGTQNEQSNYPGAEKFIEKMAQQTLDFVADESMTMEEKKAAFRNMLNRHFDLDTISRFALGRYWRQASPQQKKRYQELFREMVIEVHSDRFSDYKGQDFEVRSSRTQGEDDVLVTSYILPENDPDVRVDWRVRKKGGKYRIIDVIVSDVSMLMTKRSEFSSIIQKGGGNVDVLIEHLEKYAG